MRILVLDNYDSFVYNLVQYIGEQQTEPLVYRNDSISLREIKNLQVRGIIISPGPGNPERVRDIGICLEVIKEYTGKIPLLGVCLGHQAIIHACGGKLKIAQRIMHGKTSEIQHHQKGIFFGVKNPLRVMRYHSLIADPSTFPNQTLKIIAKTIDYEEIFAVQHKTYPVFGVQFHPESIGTEEGKLIIRNFLRICHDQ